MPAHPSIDADDPVVADLLAGTVDLILEAGGWVDPTSVLRARDGQLSLHSDAPDDATLVVVPREAMVRVDAITWSDDDEQLSVDALPDGMGDLELEMAYLQAAIHNQCGKLPWLQATHPELAADLPADVVAAVRAVIPSFRTSPMSPRDALWANRCFRLPLDASPSRVLVPIVDLLNHHGAGASGSWDGATFAVTARHPFGTDECALDYGMGRDAMESAVVYGFADTSADLAHSAPLRMALDAHATLSVSGAGRAADGAWLPISVDVSDDVTTLSHLTFITTHPRAVVEDLVARTGWDRGRAHAVADAVIEANLALLEPIARTPATTPAARTLAEAAGHQQLVLATVRDGL